MFGLFLVNGEMWQKRFPVSAYGQHFQDQWRDEEVWGLWKWHLPVGVGSAVDTHDWDGWEFWEGPHTTRGDAMDSALKFGERS